MPMYDVECPQGHQGEVLASIDDRAVACRTCGESTTRIWLRTSSGVIGDALDYYDDNLGPAPIHITSRSQRKRLMVQRGLVEKVRHVDGDRHVKRWI
jgi:hypothetical protein